VQVTAERKKWAKFGLAAQSNKGVTAQSVEQVMFERTNMPKKEEKKDAASAAKQAMVRSCTHLFGFAATVSLLLVPIASGIAITGSPSSASLRSCCVALHRSAVPLSAVRWHAHHATTPAMLQEGRSLMEVIEEKKRQRELARAKGLPVDGHAPPVEGPEGGPSAPRKEGVYVPPSRKAGLGGGAYDRPRDQDYSLRVSNLSETVSEGDLRALFGKFGDISRACVVYDRETGEHRGFAFVNFRMKSAAEKAIEFLDGYGYENMILRVEMAAPRER
jgi:RNA recognition motif. (a.k.a. RRM, RBD, or RNP domain)